MLHLKQNGPLTMGLPSLLSAILLLVFQTRKWSDAFVDNIVNEGLWLTRLSTRAQKSLQLPYKHPHRPPPYRAFSSSQIGRNLSACFFARVCLLASDYSDSQPSRATMNAAHQWLWCDTVHTDTTCCCSVTCLC